MENQTRSSRPYAASVTALTDRYRYNPYVRSTVNIILLQVLLTIIIVLVFGYALRFQQDNTLATINRTDDPSTRTVSAPLERSLEDVRDTTLQYALVGLVLLTAFFGYLTSRYALRPTRISLQFQKRFIGNMAHELRTPLAIIKTNTEVALMDSHLSPSIREILTTTSEELDRISETINNLLSFESMVRPSKVTLVAIDMTEIARSVVDRHRALAESRGIALMLETTGPALVLGNTTGIDQVLTNLIKNALNYTSRHAKGEVQVRVASDDRSVTVSVSDTGIGIAKKDLYSIFQPFYRADTSRARGVSGGTSGLGLAIVNEIVRAHHGKISVRSALNRGTTFTVELPRHYPQEVAAETEEKDEEEAKIDVA